MVFPAQVNRQLFDADLIIFEIERRMKWKEIMKGMDRRNKKRAIIRLDPSALNSFEFSLDVAFFVRAFVLCLSKIRTYKGHPKGELVLHIADAFRIKPNGHCHGLDARTRCTLSAVMLWLRFVWEALEIRFNGHIFSFIDGWFGQ